MSVKIAKPMSKMIIPDVGMLIEYLFYFYHTDICPENRNRCEEEKKLMQNLKSA